MEEENHAKTPEEDLTPRPARNASHSHSSLSRFLALVSSCASLREVRSGLPMILRAKQTQIAFPRRPLVMGIVNLNDDSFSGDGTLDVNEAIRHARRLVSEGADLIDVGGESARTNRPEISEQEEIDRVAPFIVRFHECYQGLNPIDEAQVSPPLLSVNTWRSRVANMLLDLGGDFLNDMSALSTDETARVAVRHGVGLLIMHSVGLPKQKHTDVQHTDIMQTLEQFFGDKLAMVEKAGLAREAIVIDPGLDFAKQRDDNLLILRELRRLAQFERPILLPVSRKTVIGEVLGLSDAKDRDAGTIACIVAGMRGKASIFRVHNVRAASLAVRTVWKILGDEGGTQRMVGRKPDSAGAGSA
jgi:dihydropteroate synthase